jgi:chromatin-remodeling ATPase INO80
MSTFTAELKGVKGKSKSGHRGAQPRKSKEQKQAEKDSAEAAQAAIDASEDPIELPSREESKIKLKFNHQKEA